MSLENFDGPIKHSLKTRIVCMIATEIYFHQRLTRNQTGKSKSKTKIVINLQPQV